MDRGVKKNKGIRLVKKSKGIFKRKDKKEKIKERTIMNTTKNKKPKCYNCKHASSAFKIAGKTHHQCNHPKHKKGLESGELSPWSTLQEFYNTCDTHEFHKYKMNTTGLPIQNEE